MRAAKPSGELGRFDAAGFLDEAFALEAPVDDPVVELALFRDGSDRGRRRRDLLIEPLPRLLHGTDGAGVVRGSSPLRGPIESPSASEVAPS